MRQGMKAGIACAVLIAMLGACSSPEDVAAATATATAEAGSDGAPATSASAVVFEDNAEKDGGSREFAYKWPAAVSAIPVLAERLTAERDKALAEQKTDWEAALAVFAGQNCVSCTSLSYSREWKVVADLPRYLSLSADIYLYTGGAHGNSAFEALVWDREVGAALDPAAMFRSEAALQQALGDAWCKALNAERAKRLGDAAPMEDIFPCPQIAELTLLPGSAGKTAFDRIGLIAAPYVAGSYAEGPYEVTLPVTPAVLEAVKPAYREDFALGT